MADWVNIQDSQIDPDAPLTSELAYSWRDNPIAIAEGAVGAPKVMGQALDTVLFVDQSGQVIVTDLDRVARILFFGMLTHSNTENPVSITVYVNRSSDNGATWGPDVILLQQSVAPNSNYRFVETVNVTNAANALRLRASGLSSATMTTSALSIQGVQP